jgi:hypothetical protein
VNATFEGIRSSKYLCYSPNENHYFTLPASPETGFGAWGWIEQLFMKDGLGEQMPSILPNIHRAEAQGRTMMVDIAAYRPGAVVWAYYSTLRGSNWVTREWLPLQVAIENGRFRIYFPASVISCDWFAGITFNYSFSAGSFNMSLSTPIYDATF